MQEVIPSSESKEARASWLKSTLKIEQRGGLVAVMLLQGLFSDEPVMPCVLLKGAGGL